MTRSIEAKLLCEFCEDQESKSHQSRPSRTLA